MKNLLNRNKGLRRVGWTRTDLGEVSRNSDQMGLSRMVPVVTADKTVRFTS